MVVNIAGWKEREVREEGDMQDKKPPLGQMGRLHHHHHQKNDRERKKEKEKLLNNPRQAMEPTAQVTLHCL